MKLALECSTQLLDLVQPFADFDFILAGEYLKDKECAEFYKKSTNSKIVDNSVNEEGEPLPLDQIEKVFKEVGADFLVAPDWIGNSVKTRGAYLEAVKKVGKEKVIGVVQGETFEEALECLETYRECPIISIPYDICSKKTDSPWLMGLRRALLISNIPQEFQIHLLGYNCLEEFMWYKMRPNVLSIDTGVPILLGLEEKDILDPLSDKKLPTLNQMKDLKLTQKSWGIICRNIALLRKFL